MSSFQLFTRILSPILILVFGYFFFHLNNSCSTSSAKKGTVIVLNGPSASGKTSLQKELQLILDDFYMRVGVDNFFDAILPDAIGKSMVKKELNQIDFEYYTSKGILHDELARATAIFEQSDNHNILIRAGVQTTDDTGKPLFVLIVGPQGEDAIKGMHRAIAAYAHAGYNVLVDYILYEQAWLKDLTCVLKDLDVYFIGVDIPLDILEEREKARATSPVGHARSHYNTVHQNCIYDYRVDTSKLSTVQAAIEIKQFIQQNKNPVAFIKNR